MSQNILADFVQQGFELLKREDELLYSLLEKEHHRQVSTLTMVAASSLADPSVIACMGTTINNLTTEGYPSKRFHGGCHIADDIENLAIERAKKAFSACYANVQPHSGTTANQIVLCSLLQPGDRIMGLSLKSGGHLTHGSSASVIGRWFDVTEYSVDQDNLIDYESIYKLACETRPKLIIAGASSYPRIIDFEKFRAIADAVGAFLLADISHIAGLVVAGEHPSPIDYAHFTTTSTYKQLYGPRGGLILMGKDYASPAPNGKTTLADWIQRATFPFLQGTPNLNAIAAKASALRLVTTPEFKQLAARITTNAKALASHFLDYGYRVLTNGTDNHLVLMDVSANGLTGFAAEKALEECSIVVNRNTIPGDKRSATVTSGLRLGTNSLAARGMGAAEMHICAEVVHKVLSSIHMDDEHHFSLSDSVKNDVIPTVEQLCHTFPIPRY